jgi:hypothetical protein
MLKLRGNNLLFISQTLNKRTKFLNILILLDPKYVLL